MPTMTIRSFRRRWTPFGTCTSRRTATVCRCAATPFCVARRRQQQHDQGHEDSTARHLRTTHLGPPWRSTGAIAASFVSVVSCWPRRCARDRRSVQVAFITGRTEGSRDFTERNLKAEGFGEQCPEGKDGKALFAKDTPCYVHLHLRSLKGARLPGSHVCEVLAPCCKCWARGDHRHQAQRVTRCVPATTTQACHLALACKARLPAVPTACTRLSCWTVPDGARMPCRRHA